MEDIKKLADKYESYIVERRREYHQYPELSLEEAETTKRLKRDLEEMGLEVQTFSDMTGLIAVIHGGKPGRTIAFRSDIDGLKVKEETGLPFASTNGNMHACGHDNHMSMLLGAARILMDVKDELCGNVKLIFQPAEEVAVGARRMIEHGAMDGVDAVVGMHVWADLDEGKINFQPGNRMAGCDTFQIHVKGFAAHGSAPHHGVDAIVAAASIIMNLQTFVSRTNDPVNPLVVTIGTINGGSRFNILANSVEMEGTVRTFNREFQKVLPDKMRTIIENTAKALGAEASLDYQYMTVPVINTDDELNRLGKDAIVKLYGEEAYGSLDAMMGSEDFSFFSEHAPSIYGYVGTRNEKEGRIYSNHHEKYDMAECMLKKGSAVMAQLAVDYLNSGK